MREWSAQEGRSRTGDDAVEHPVRRPTGAGMAAQSADRLGCKEVHEIPALMYGIGAALGQMADEIDGLEKVYSPAMTPEDQRPGTIGAAQPAQTQIGVGLAAHLQTLISLNERLRGFAARCQL